MGDGLSTTFKTKNSVYTTSHRTWVIALRGKSNPTTLSNIAAIPIISKSVLPAIDRRHIEGAESWLNVLAFGRVFYLNTLRNPVQNRIDFRTKPIGDHFDDRFRCNLFELDQSLHNLKELRM